MSLQQMPPMQPPPSSEVYRRVLKPDRASPAVVSVLAYDRMTTCFAVALLCAIVLGGLLMVQSIRLGNALSQADHVRLRLAAHEEFREEQRRDFRAALFYYPNVQTNETSKVESTP